MFGLVQGLEEGAKEVLVVALHAFDGRVDDLQFSSA